MGDPKGFLKIGRKPVPKRPVSERVRDYRWVYEPMPEVELRQQASRCMDCGVPFCNTGCPVNNLIPDWNDLVYRDHWREAIDRLHATNNFPEFTGILCPAPCEAACVLSINDSPVTIKEIERSIIERAFEEGWVVPKPPPPERRTGKRVAVVGSGPAGLAAAQQLNRAGHTVVVFEKDDRIGGLLRYGIPDFKMEKWVIDRRLRQLEEEGIEFRTNAHVGYDPTTEELRRDFDAVVLAVGALQGRDLPVPGRELSGIHLAMEYLVQQNRRVAGLPVEGEEITARGKHVIILGGGDTSADCLGNAHREGAASVKVLTHGPRPPESPDPLEWPDWPFVLHTYPAHEEGGERGWNVAVTGFSGENGRVKKMHCVRTRRDPDGRTHHLPGTGFELEADLVLLAIGFTGPVRDRLLEELEVEFGPRGAIATRDGFDTGVPGVFVAGDARRGADLIVTAIADGRKAARQVDRYLMGRSLLPG
ncbi:Glutamate synthase [NADPH] small chain [Rubrobacter xylanophilus DSM 9941]|uniref:glutamate synthase subunit beta n=1 Tax=Rubrobacter xylanophilus TaxID=49319 RepID=UPI001C6419FA|nr:glutamate synthase subunit beta [Rubrobacter xylanophilus]QYJ16575.1 Glutamate synthase [NADPH] small chain [Rubrobacter xylanophilus DSM 9941]